MIADKPVFIHSLFRSGSTYFFNVFRRAGGYWCYQEPEHEELIHLNDEPRKLLQIFDEATRQLRHPSLDKPYFWEFYEISGALRGLFKKSFSYDVFFSCPGNGLSADQKEFFRALIDNARGVPVMQCCRSFGRAGAMKEVFGGIHIHLWREPRSQWWSYKVNDYFDAVTNIIYGADCLPPVLSTVKKQCGITNVRNDQFAVELDYAKNHPLGFAHSYFAFYAIWLFSFISCACIADINIDMDRLSNEVDYRDQTQLSLSEFGIEHIDLTDCHMPRMNLSENELAFYLDIENKVKGLFLQFGYDVDYFLNLATVPVTQVDQKTGQELRVNAIALRGVVAQLYDRLDAHARFSQSKIDQLNQQIVRADGQLKAMYESSSWKITKPLRVIAEWFKH